MDDKATWAQEPPLGSDQRLTCETGLRRRHLLGYAGAATALAWLSGCTTDEEVQLRAALTHTIVGDPHSDGFTVSSRTSGASEVRLKVATNPRLTAGSVYSPAVAPDGHGWAKMTVTGLAAGTDYYYDVELTDSAGSRLSGQLGRGKTLPTPGEPASFAFAFGSCMASGVKNRTVMDRILAHDPLLFLHLGDFGYFDNRSTDVASHRQDYQRQLSANAGLGQVLAEIPSYFIQSDHDAGGGNNAGAGPWTGPNRAAYRQVFPHPDIAGHEDGLYWSVVVGRIRLIFTDHNTYCSRASAADTPSKTLMGTAQKHWFKSQLGEAEPVKIWVQAAPFISTRSSGATWGSYSTEQGEIADFIREQAVGEVVTVHGDMHAVAVSTKNPWGLRSWAAAPFDQVSSHKGGPWTSGPFPAAEGKRSTRQYGYVEVNDSGERLEVAFTGYNSSEEPLVSDTLRVNGP